jgi:hypothetical protein
MHIYRITDGDEKHIGNVNINLKRYSSGQPSRNWYRVVDMVFLLLLFVVLVYFPAISQTIFRCSTQTQLNLGVWGEKGASFPPRRKANSIGRRPPPSKIILSYPECKTIDDTLINL